MTLLSPPRAPWGSVCPESPPAPSRPSHTAGATCGIRSRLLSWLDSLCPFGWGSWLPSLGMFLHSQTAVAGASRPHHASGAAGNPSGPRPFLFRSWGLGFPNQVKELVNIFRTRDSALTSLRATAKSPTSIPSSVSIPSPLHPTLNHS